MSELPLLSLMILTLPTGAALIWLLPAREGMESRQARFIALITALADLVLSVTAVIRFDAADPGFQLVERAAWIPTLNVQWLVGVDGLSLLFLPFTVLLFIGVIVGSWTSVRTLPRLYYSLLLLLESATLGIFCAMDTLLFFLFWELTLIPLYFLISLWGVGANRRYAAVKYTMLMLVGGVPLLFGFLLLAFNHAELHGALSFDYPALLATVVAPQTQTLVFFLLLIGFAVKAPVFPLHTWLTSVAMEGPVGVAAIMTGLKLGAYGMIRFVVPLTPEAARDFHWLLAGLGVVGILYGAVVAMAQTNLRRMLAFSSHSHVGLVVLGIASMNLQGIQGAVFQLLNFSVVAGGLFLLTGFIHHRTGSTDLIHLGGLARTMPMATAFFLLFGLAGMGVPGTNGFIAEFLILISALETHTGAGLAALFGVVLGAAYFLHTYRHAFLGPITNPVVHQLQDLRPRELALAALLALIVLTAGLHPAPILDLTRASAEAWTARLAR